MIIQFDSSVLDENDKYICFFEWKFFGNWDQYLTRTMDTKVKFHEWRRLGSFAASFFLTFLSHFFFLAKLTLIANESYWLIVRSRNLRFWSNLRSRWLDISLFLFFSVFMDWDYVEVHKNKKQKNWNKS